MAFRLFFLLIFFQARASAHDRESGAPPPELEAWLDAVVLLVTGPSWCSGVLIDDQGTVATAYHCVAGGQRPRVETRDGKHYIGRTVAWKHSDDLALVSVPELSGRAHLQPLTEPPVLGSHVYGLGHPFAPAADRKPAMKGLLQWSVSEGIVSAVSERLIQTDTALNPGNSGGPVVDYSGRIVGITSHKINGDNIAFLASSKALLELVESPEKPVFGGQWGLSLGSVGGMIDNPALNLELMAHAVVRERLVGTFTLGIPIGARDQALDRGQSWAVANELSLALRQRFGRGQWSTAIDVGAGMSEVRRWRGDVDPETHTVLVFLESEWLPSGFARVGMGGAWLKVGVLWDDSDPVWLIGVEVDWPGTLGTF